MSAAYKSFSLNKPDVRIVFSGKKLGNMQSSYSGQVKTGQNIQNLKNKIGKNLSLLEIDAIGGNVIETVKEGSDDIGSRSIVCDGIITNCKKVALGLYAADCIPMVIASNKKPVLGLIHVGTSGADMSIHIDSVNLFFDEFGIEPKDIQIYLGPHIKKESYKLKDIDNKNLNLNKWQKFISKNSGFYFIDLGGYVINSLINTGVKRSNILISNVDTYSNADYFSHRRSKLTGEAEGRNGFMCALN